MTGFGLGLSGRGNNRVEIEIRAMNSRFLEVKIRGLNINFETEEKIRSKISKSLNRGNVQVVIGLSNSTDIPKLKFNKQRYEIIQNVIPKPESRVEVKHDINKEVAKIIEHKALPEPKLKTISPDDDFNDGADDLDKIKGNIMKVLSKLDQAEVE